MEIMPAIFIACRCNSALGISTKCTTKTNLKPAMQYNFSTVRCLDVTCAIYTQLGHSRKVEMLGNADLSSAQLHREKGAQNDGSCIWNVHGIPQSTVRVAQLLPLQPLTTVAVAS